MSFSERLYADRKAPDGGFASGWRIVKKGGRIKCAGHWYANERLKELEGELVSVMMGEYWESWIVVSRGVVGCSSWFCNAGQEGLETDSPWLI